MDKLEELERRWRSDVRERTAKIDAADDAWSDAFEECAEALSAIRRDYVLVPREEADKLREERDALDVKCDAIRAALHNLLHAVWWEPLDRGCPDMGTRLGSAYVAAEDVLRDHAKDLRGHDRSARR